MVGWKAVIAKDSKLEAKKAGRPLAFLHPLSQRSSPCAVVGPCYLCFAAAVEHLHTVLYPSLPPALVFLLPLLGWYFSTCLWWAACFSFSWLFISELSQMFFRCLLLPVSFLPQGNGMSLYSEEVFREMLPSHGYGNRGCCWHVQLVHPCSWVRDYQRALFLSGLSNSNVKKGICWIACTMVLPFQQVLRHLNFSEMWGAWVPVPPVSRNFDLYFSVKRCLV